MAGVEAVQRCADKSCATEGIKAGTARRRADAHLLEFALDGTGRRAMEYKSSSLYGSSFVQLSDTNGSFLQELKSSSRSMHVADQCSILCESGGRRVSW